MALQGNLRDFSAMEILQLVGSQKKSGCLVMEWNTEKVVVWTVDFESDPKDSATVAEALRAGIGAGVDGMEKDLQSPER